jgi:MFS transporter, YNFM family, putative membrane transport protein
MTFKMEKDYFMMDYIEIGSRQYRKALVCMLVGSLVTFATLYCPQPLLSVFSEQYHVSPATASFTISFATGALAVSMLFVPILTNAWGRKRVMSISLFLTSLLAILSAFCHNFQLLLTLRLLEGISLAGFPATAMAYLGEEFSPRSIGRIMGVYVAGTGVGGFVGRVVIGTLTDFYSWQLALLSLGIFSLLCSIWFWLNLPESRNFRRVTISFAHWAESLKAGLSHKNLLYLYGIGFLAMGAYVVVLNYIGYPLRRAPYHLSQTLLGLLFVVNLVGLWSSVLFGKLADRFPRVRVISWAMALFISGAFLTLHWLLWVKIVGLTVLVFGFFASHAVASGWIGVVAPREIKAQASSLYLLFYYTGSSLIGWSGGFFWARFGWSGVIGLDVGALMVATLLAYQIHGTAQATGKGETTLTEFQ